MSRKIELYEVSDADEWESDLGKFDPSPFIAPRWLEAVSCAARVPVYLDFRSGAEIVGKIAGLRIKKGERTGRLFFYSAPAVQTPNRELVGAMIDELLDYSAANRLNRLLIRKYDSPFVLEGGRRNIRISRDEEYLIDLTQSKEELEERFKKTFRQRVRKAERNGALFFETESTEFVDKLISFLEEVKTLRMKKGYEDYSYFYLPYLNEEVLRTALDSGLAKIFYVTLGSRVCSVRYTLIYKKRAYALLIGGSTDSYKTGVPSFLHYSHIHRLKEMGCESLNMAGAPETSSQPGIVSFKKSMGARERCCSNISSDYLLFPYTLLNPLLGMARKLPESAMKKFMRKVM